jgi:hypothetical protein
MHVNTAETDREREIVFPCVPNPMRAKKIIEDIMRRRDYLITHHDRKGAQVKREG